MEEQFEVLGVAEVKARLATNQWRSDSKTGRAANGWLAKKGQLEAEAQGRLAIEALAQARSSKHAAWASVVVAVLALLVAATAMIRSTPGA